MTQGALKEINVPYKWDWERLWSAAPRIQIVGQPDAEPLSVFLQVGVVPRSSREDNHNQLGEDLSKYQVVRPGDLVFNKLRTWQGGLGVSNHHGIVSPAYFVCRPRIDWHPRYLHYLLLSTPYLAELTRLSKFMPPSQFDIPWEMLRTLLLLRPPLDEQRRIADFLDVETARIDALIEQKRRMVALLKEHVQAVINEVTPGAIVHGLDGRPVGIAGMECVRLGAVAVIQGGFTMDAGRDNGADSVTLPYLRVANVLDGSLALEDIKEVTLPRALAERCTLRPGDVLMTEGGDPDKLGRGTVWPGDLKPCLHQNAIFAIRPDSRLMPEYLALVTRTQYARAYFEMTASKSTGIAHTSSMKITGFRVPMRTVAEQLRVVRLANESVARMDVLRGLAERQVNLLVGRRQALITAAVTGGISV